MSVSESRSKKAHPGNEADTGPPTGLRAVLRYDLPASFVVFLVAVPLSLGIAAASGAPLIAGLIAAVVGGVLGGLLSGAPLQVAGPAAGLTVIVAGLVAQFGWAATAAITVGAGLLQILLGLTRVGRLALSLSPAVVHGMLAGIGVTIAVGQLHVMLGGSNQGSVLENLAGLPAQILGLHPGALLVGAITIAVMMLWPKLPKVNVVPAPLVAVGLGTAVAAGFQLDLVRVALPSDIINEVVLPQLPSGPVLAIVGGVLTVALVASVESLLSAVAVDKLHDGPRANLDKELVAQGAANMVSGALGGLPVTGVIVRSSTNVAAGAKTRWSTVLHGVWMLLAVLLLAGVLRQIPMAALAAVLVVIGVKLVSVAHMKQLWRHREMVVYAATLLGVIAFGLVEGVLVGLAVALVRAFYRLTHSTVDVQRVDGRWWVTVRGSLVFLGAGRLVRELRAIPLRESVVLELHVDFMDHGVFEVINDWRVGYERTGGKVRVDEVLDSWYHRAIGGRPARRKSIRSTVPPRWFAPWSHWQLAEPADVQLPAQAAEDDHLIAGVRAFDQHAADLVRPFLSELAEHGQKPKQLFITCSDSRVLPNMFTSSGPGDQFSLRNVGNLVPAHGVDASVGAAVEYAVDVLAVQEIVVCGHSDCGAMKAVLAQSVGEGSALYDWLRYAEPSLLRLAATAGEDAELPANERLCLANIAQQLENLRSYPNVAAAVAAGKVKLVGMYFDIAAAKAFLVDPDRRALRDITV
ncbi:SulP family inorganic anion transporter [Kutzneria sp. CA-103260]|uniref:SulP family inorganic anion transporter n=1 Tax=Kutzneria sp. CA-103260 TaxID=2802641 RepID=UPI001BEE3C2C|nr:bifunctional SulP family inorganic anion transporter/carbonic anhydrase [Kutzneria sp. CA-103260]QUQ71810.1 bifunctional sulfate permease/carbonic anhydrase [Kutzneria sp. CA-103260]